MPKIVEIDNDTVNIETDEGYIKQVTLLDCYFEPCIGDEVEITYREGKTIVTRAKNTPRGAYQMVNKRAYCILIIIGSWTGLHKFYLGKPKAGFLFLAFAFTCIPAIFALIELLQTLFKPADINGNIIVKR